MKNYEYYNSQPNVISLGKLCVLNDSLAPQNKLETFRQLDGYIFLFLADVDYNDLLREYFSDYAEYFNIELIDQDITKDKSTKKYNVFRLQVKS